MISDLDTDGLAAELARRPGLIPTSLVKQSGKEDTIVWTDLGKWHLQGGFFHDSLAEIRSLARQPLAEYYSPISALLTHNWENSLEPSALIFHAGRCGSTLLSSVLARSRQHLVYCEAPVHNQIWGLLPDRGAGGLKLYRALARAMGQRRNSSWIAHIIKFTSYNVMEWKFVRSAFPGAPALFLFRDPAEMLASFAKGPPGWLERDLGIGARWDYMNDAIQDFFRSALAAQGQSFRCLNYRHLKPENLPAILRYLGLDGAETDLARMKTAFNWDAKSGLAPRPFLPRAGHSLSESIPVELNKLYLQLDSVAKESWPFADHAPAGSGA